jgi:energy-coupling factor transporter ATP-binding protein EcfA2
MSQKVLIAHAAKEEHEADKLASPLREAGYDVCHRGTIFVGESPTEEAHKLLSGGAPVVLCATVRAVGTQWARRIVRVAQQTYKVRVFPVLMEADADVHTLSGDSDIANYAENPSHAIDRLIEALRKHYPLENVLKCEDGSKTQNLIEEYCKVLLRESDLITIDPLERGRSPSLIGRLDYKLQDLYVPLRVFVQQKPGETGFRELLSSYTRRQPFRPEWIGRESNQDSFSESGAYHLGHFSGAEPRSEAIGARRGGQGIDSPPRRRVSIGERLAESKRLVVLGDPGSGKSTLLRWIAVASILRLRRDPRWQNLPDVDCLPDVDMVPIIVPCRDLDPACFKGSIAENLQQLLKQRLAERYVGDLVTVLLEHLRSGTAIFMLDGLDEIKDPSARSDFGRQVEKFIIACENPFVIATSRIAGYGEMRSQLGPHFEHVTLSDLEPGEKDDFLRKWYAFSNRGAQSTAAEDLIPEIHGSARIERLTGNPMVLTTVALVNETLGKPPKHVTQLYHEAIHVFLRRGKLDWDDVVPQLSYLAYAMCERRDQRLIKKDAIKLLKCMRHEYPEVPRIQNSAPEVFLRTVKGANLIGEIGHVELHGRPETLYGFPHLTFQEYLAARAILDNHVPGVTAQSRSLAEKVAALAGRTSGATDDYTAVDWWEPLRLVIAMSDNEAEEVLGAVLDQFAGEDRMTGRIRAGLAGLCLADEPNVSAYFANTILEHFVAHVNDEDGRGTATTTHDRVAVEISKSRYAGCLIRKLVNRYCQHDSARLQVAMGG